MNVNVHSIHFDADGKLVGFIQEKLNKLTLFHDNILSAEVFLRLEHDGQKRTAKTFEEAASSTVEALRTQVERTKERLRKAS
jgi:putative sigma-54 modulation protein